MNYRRGQTWKLFVTVFIACLSILHRSEVFAARLGIMLPSSSSSTNETLPGMQNETTTVRVPTTIDQPEGIEERIPNHILRDILLLDDNLKCFPKLLCTIYQDKEITRQGFLVNTTDLALAYIKLIKAVNYKKKPTTTTTEAPKRKRPIIQVFKIPMGLITASTYQGRKDLLNRRRRPIPQSRFPSSLSHYPYHLRSPLPFVEDDNEDEDFPYNLRREEEDMDDKDSRAYLREKVRMSQLMKDLKDEENEEMMEDMPNSGGLATSLLASFLPFVGSPSSTNRGANSRLQRSLNFLPISGNSRTSRRSKGKKPQDPFQKAVDMWRNLKKRSQCESMYKTCPFQPWEVVRMLDLIRGQSHVLAAYLKITVDNVKPKRRQ